MTNFVECLRRFINTVSGSRMSKQTSLRSGSQGGHLRDGCPKQALSPIKRVIPNSSEKFCRSLGTPSALEAYFHHHLLHYRQYRLRPALSPSDNVTILPCRSAKKRAHSTKNHLYCGIPATSHKLFPHSQPYKITISNRDFDHQGVPSYTSLI